MPKKGSRVNIIELVFNIWFHNLSQELVSKFRSQLIVDVNRIKSYSYHIYLSSGNLVFISDKDVRCVLEFQR